ncbi:MAG: molybdate/tungstate transport system substrate-binding protein [Halobacteriales archaeon]|jgi:molybdate/tungstate transport system substrate-binding protein
MTGEANASRRGFLAGLASAGTALSLAGCSALGGGSPVSIMAAGSLLNAFTESLPDETDHEIRVEAYGSARVARMIAEEQRDPDLVALADTTLFESLLDADWYGVFATNAMAVAYNPDTAGGQAVRDADRWYEPLLDGRARLGRSDPKLDPLGYRTLFALELAAAHYDEPGLADSILARKQIYPETQLMAQFETGSVDAAFVYENMAIERDYPFVDLPAAIDLSDPDREENYAETSYELPDGTTVRGGPIEYGARRRTNSAAATDVYETMVESAADYLEPHGFVVRSTYPIHEGDVPDAIED